MPRYIIERSVPGLTREELMAAGRRSAVALADMPDVRWIRSYVSDAEGKIYCEYDAPSAEAIREHARRAARTHPPGQFDADPRDCREDAARDQSG